MIKLDTVLKNFIEIKLVKSAEKKNILRQYVKVLLKD